MMHYERGRSGTTSHPGESARSLVSNNENHSERFGGCGIESVGDDGGVVVSGEGGSFGSSRVRLVRTGCDVKMPIGWAGATAVPI